MLERAEEAGYAAVEPLVAWCARAGVSPDSVTALGLLVSFVAGGLLYIATAAAYAAAVGLVLVNGVLDVVDGELARRTGTADARGDILDHTVDRYADAVLVGGAAAGVGAWLLGALAVSGVILVADAGAAAQVRSGDRVYGGLLTRADISTLVVLGGSVSAAGIGAPLAGREPFGVVLVVIAVAAHTTVVQRSVHAARLADDS